MMTREHLKSKLLTAVAQEYGVSKQMLKSRDRYQPLPEARAILFYIGTRYLQLTTYEVSSIVDRKHSNAVTQGNKIEYRQQIYPEIRNRVLSIAQALDPDRMTNPYFEMYANLGGYEGDNL
jgi:chromosomal replication initiation ATPase DnaA